MNRRVGVGWHLRVVEGAPAKRYEGDPLGEHERHEQVVAACHFAHHDQGANRDVSETSVEGAHADQRESAWIDAGIVQEHGLPTRPPTKMITWR